MSGMIQVNFSSKLNLSFYGLIKLFQKKSHLNGGSMLLAEREGLTASIPSGGTLQDALSPSGLYSFCAI
jgi:hypothetical protein